MYVAIVETEGQNWSKLPFKTRLCGKIKFALFPSLISISDTAYLISMGDKMEIYITIEQVAEHLKLAENTIRRWVRNGEIPHHRINRVIRFRLSEVERWLDRSGAYIAQNMSEGMESSQYPAGAGREKLQASR